MNRCGSSVAPSPSRAPPALLAWRRHHARRGGQIPNSGSRSATSAIRSTPAFGKRRRRPPRPSDIELIILDTKRDISTEANNVDQLITQQVDLIMIMPTSAEGSRAAIDRGIAAGIPVITVLDSAQGSGEEYVYVGLRLRALGRTPRRQARAQLLGDKGNIVYIKGGAGFLVEQNRDRPVQGGDGKAPRIEGRLRAARRLEQAVRRHPHGGRSCPHSARPTASRPLSRTMTTWRSAQSRPSSGPTGSTRSSSAAMTAMPMRCRPSSRASWTYTTFQDGETIGREGIETAVKILEGQEVPKLVPRSAGRHRQ